MHARYARTLIEISRQHVCLRCRFQFANRLGQGLRRYKHSNDKPDAESRTAAGEPKSFWKTISRLLSKPVRTADKVSDEPQADADTLLKEPYSQEIHDRLIQEHKQHQQNERRVHGSSQKEPGPDQEQTKRALTSSERRRRRRKQVGRTIAQRSDPKPATTTTKGPKTTERNQRGKEFRSFRIKKRLTTRSFRKIYYLAAKAQEKISDGGPGGKKSTGIVGADGSSFTQPRVVEEGTENISQQLSQSGKPTGQAGAQSDGANKLTKSKPVKKLGKKQRIKPFIRERSASELSFTPIPVEQPPVPRLAYGLERVLFNPGVYQLQDPRSRVYNFDPYLQNIMPVQDFDFNALKGYITSSKDEALKQLARQYGKRYIGSTSSMTAMLAHFHYLLSQWRPINTSMLSKSFPDQSRTFTELLRCPSAIFLKYQDGTYAIDADKQFDHANVLQLLGKSLEKLLVLRTEEYEKYRKSSANGIPNEEKSAPDSYHYSGLGDFLMRSQLDAHDPRLPGTGMFDLKTRAVVSIRMDVMNYEQGVGYEIRDTQGAYESYEREYYDMIRAAFLKYSMQVRMGRMDGIFVAFHNVQRIFGFQYVSIEDMDLAVHGQKDTSLGDQEFALSIDLLNEMLNRVTKDFPKTSIRLHFETRDAATPFMYIFAEPVDDADMAAIQSANAATVEGFEKRVLGQEQAHLNEDDRNEESRWEDMEASVQDAMDQDELGFDQGSEHSVTDSNQGVLKTDHSVTGNDHSDVTALQDSDAQATSTLTGAPQGDIRNMSQQESEKSQNPSYQHIMTPSVRNQEHSQVKNAGIRSDALCLQKSDCQGTTGKGKAEKDASSSEQSQENHSVLAKASTEGSSAVLKDPQKCERTLASDHEEVKEFETQADGVFMEEIDDSADTPVGKVLALTLTLRNKINGSYTLRPENLKKSDKWAIEYSLIEVTDKHRAWALYQACLKRRKKKLEAMPEEDTTKVNYYVQNLRKLSQQGLKWRKIMDQQDKERPTHVLATDGDKESK